MACGVRVMTRAMGWVVPSVFPGNLWVLRWKTKVKRVVSAARLTSRSLEVSRLAIHALHEAGILVQSAKSKKSNIYVARDVIDAFTAYERSLATPGGDTATEKPVRPVPQRVSRERRREANGSL